MINNDTIKILLTGDYYPYPTLKKYCNKHKNSHKLFGDLLPKLKEADIAGINVEFPITKSNNAIRKVGPNIKGDAVTLNPLSKAGFNLAYISNNHTLDFGKDGLNDTIVNLKQNNITPIGIGRNLEEARKPYVKVIKGKKIAFLNFSENEFNVASENSPGANPLNIINNVKDIRLAKAENDFVFLVIHAGQDFNHHPPPFMLRQLRFYAEEGASAIICHHSHYIAGYEEYKNVPIFYGLGNIIYPQKYEVERQKTLVVQFKIKENNSFSYEVIPCYFDPVEMKLFNAYKGNKFDFSEQMEYLNSIVINDELNKKHWLAQLKIEEYYRYLVLIGSLPHLVFRIFKKIKRLKYLDKFLSIRNKKFYYIWNLIRRETHRDALIHIFEDKFKNKF